MSYLLFDMVFEKQIRRAFQKAASAQLRILIFVVKTHLPTMNLYLTTLFRGMLNDHLLIVFTDSDTQTR